MLNPIEKFKVTILHLNRAWNHWNKVNIDDFVIFSHKNISRKFKYVVLLLQD